MMETARVVLLCALVGCVDEAPVVLEVWRQEAAEGSHELFLQLKAATQDEAQQTLFEVGQTGSKTFGIYLDPEVTTLCMSFYDGKSCLAIREISHDKPQLHVEVDFPPSEPEHQDWLRCDPEAPCNTDTITTDCTGCPP